MVTANKLHIYFKQNMLFFSCSSVDSIIMSQMYIILLLPKNSQENSNNHFLFTF